MLYDVWAMDQMEECYAIECRRVIFMSRCDLKKGDVVTSALRSR